MYRIESIVSKYPKMQPTFNKRIGKRVELELLAEGKCAVLTYVDRDNTPLVTSRVQRIVFSDDGAIFFETTNSNYTLTVN